ASPTRRRARALMRPASFITSISETDLRTITDLRLQGGLDIGEDLVGRTVAVYTLENAATGVVVDQRSGRLLVYGEAVAYRVFLIVVALSHLGETDGALGAVVDGSDIPALEADPARSKTLDDDLEV